MAISPHLFRHCAATSIATDDPENVITTLAILGNSSFATAEQTYNQASTVTAARRYHEAILALRSVVQAPDLRKDKPMQGYGWPKKLTK